jgi:biotin carboxylase
MKKILIVGGSHSELPLVDEAKKLGLYTICIGNIKGNAHFKADESHLIDYSDKELVLKFAKEKNIDYICFGAHDLSMTTTAYVAEKLGFCQFDKYETTMKLHHKDRFKQLILKHNLSTTKVYKYKNIEKIKFPVIVKPIDLGGGKGISIAKDKIQLKKAITYASECSKTKQYIIEEYFYGSLHSISTFIVDKKIRFFYHDDEFDCPDNKFGVCLSISPSSDFSLIEKQLLKEIEKVIDIFDLKDGLLHLQFLQNNDRFSIIEFTRRMPGDMYNVPVETSTGLNYAKTIIKFAIGEKEDIFFKKQKKITGRHCVVDENIIPEKNVFSRVKLINATKQEIVFFEFTDTEYRDFITKYNLICDFNQMDNTNEHTV